MKYQAIQGDLLVRAHQSTADGKFEHGYMLDDNRSDD